MTAGSSSLTFITALPLYCQFFPLYSEVWTVDKISGILITYYNPPRRILVPSKKDRITECRGNISLKEQWQLLIMFYLINDNRYLAAFHHFSFNQAENLHFTTIHITRE